MIISRFKGTSLIEGLWGELKAKIRDIYRSIPGDNNHFDSFLYEALWRRSLVKLDASARIEFLFSTYSFTNATDEDPTRLIESLKALNLNSL